MSESPDTQRLQLAVERVRAAALDMRCTGDLRRVVAVMYREMLDLGIDNPGISIFFLDEAADEVHHVVGLRDPRSMGIDWSPDRSEREIVVEGDAIAIGGGFFIDIPGLESGPEYGLEFGGTSMKFAGPGGIAAWRAHVAGRVDWDAPSSTYAEEISADEFGPRLRALGLDEEQAQVTSKRMLGRWYVTNVRYRFGMVGYRERQHDPAHDTVVAELARGLELGFLRFLDLQASEERVREAELERAVESVRAAAMAMSSTDDLPVVVTTLYREATQLGLELPTVGILFVREDRGVYEIYNVTDVTSEAGVLLAARDRLVPDLHETDLGFGLVFSQAELSLDTEGLAPVINAWRSGETDVLEMRYLDADLQTRFIDSHFDDDLKARWRTAMVDPWQIHNVPFRYGTVGCHSRQTSPWIQQVLEALAAALDLGYLRFLDFQKLEQRNRELEIEQSVERVRTAVAGMESSEDLEWVRQRLDEELRTLGVPCEEVGINHLPGGILEVVSDEHAQSPPQLSNWGAHFRRRETFQRRYLTEEIEEDARWLTDRELLTKEQGRGWRELALQTGGLWVVDVFFEQGSLAMNKRPPEPFSDDDVRLLERFTEVFALAYRRHLDLRDAEDRARQAEIERAVETVRAAAEGMHESGDLRNLCTILQDCLCAVGVPVRNLNINLVDEADRTMRVYNPGAADRGTIAFDDADRHEVAQYLDRWHQGGHWQRLWTIEQNRGLMEKWGSMLWESERTPEQQAFVDDFNSTERWVVDAFFSHGAVALDKPAPAPFSDADLLVIERLTAVFAVGYRRHLELADAEGRARQAELERGVERVRAAAMAMQSTDDLPEVVGTIYREAIQLGIEIPGIGINFVHGDRDVIEMWNVWPRTGDYSTAGQVLHSAGTRLVHVGDDLNCVTIEMATAGANQPIVDAWHSGETTVVFRDYAGEEWVSTQRKTRERSDLPNEVMDAFESVFGGAWHVYNVPFAYGAVGCHSRESSPWIQQVLEALGGALNLGYLRFLDFQTLEQNNRELVVEQALERLRTGVAAMESSQDVTHLADQLGEEVRGLGVPFDGFAINQFDPARREWTPTHSDDPSGAQLGRPVPVDLLTVMREWAAHWERHETLIRFVDSEAWAKQNDELLSSGWIPEDRVEETRSELERDTRDRWVVDCFFDDGSLAMNRIGTEPFADQDVRLLERFTEVFATGFRRHLELKDAEDRARRAEIDLGVERVRATSMGMDSSEDLPGVVGTVYREMQRLGVTARGVAINFVEEEAGEFDVWSVYPLRSNDRFRLRFNREDSPIDIGDDLCGRHYRVPLDHSEGWRLALEGWRAGTPSLQPTTIDGNEIRRIFARHYEDGDAISEDIVEFYTGDYQIVNVPFTRGMIGYHGRDLPDDHVDLVRALAGALELGYLRYFDLQAAEQRTRDAEIERSLERVRTAIAAMQDSSGILGLVDTIRAELANLGAVADDRFGINTIDPTTQCIVVRTGIARGSHERIIPQAEEMSPESLFGEWRRRLSPGVHWHRRLTVDEEIHSRTIEARRLGNVLPSDWERHVRARGDTDVLDLYFEQGSLAVSRTTGPYTDDEIALLRRFTDVFALGYRRHLDLTEAEARTRQADIDLSVERVRATSMAMNDTDDLPSVVGALAREMHRLGVCSATVGINFVSEPGTEIDVWNVHRRHPWPGLEVREGVLIEVDEDFCCHHFRETPTALATEETTWQVVVDAWRSGEPQVTDGTWTRAGLESWARGWLDGSDEAFNAFAAASAGSIRLLNVPFAYGAIGYNQPQRDDHIEIVQSLAGALELGYLRYFDLQAAEQRARDAQLARARQHVRSVVTAMKTADDITDVVVVLRDELRYLGVPCDQVGVNIANEEAGTIEGSWSSALGDVGVTRGGAHGQTASAARLMEIWKAGETWNRARAEADPGALGWVVDVAFDFGTLAMNRGQTNDDAAEFSDDEIAMLHSFADEVSLGYRRFRDFETLEAQNRRLSLESALQRLRAEVASMAETDDIARVMGTVFSELRGVGVPAVSANIIVIDEPARFSRQYVLIPHYWYERGLVGTPAISDVVDGIDLFRGDRPLRDEDDWIDVVEPDLRELTWDAASFAVVRKQYRKQFGFDVQGEPGLTQQIRMPFSHGVLLFFAGQEAAFDDSHLEIVQEFARMLSLGYSRYLDFETLEAQNRRLATERAVERVRAEATGLTSSEDAWRVIAALWDGLTDAGLEFTTCGVQIVDEEAGLLSISPAVTRDLGRRWLPDQDKLSRADIVGGVDLYHTRVELDLARSLGWATPDIEPRIDTMPEGFGKILHSTWGGGNFGAELDGLQVMNVPFSHGGIAIFAPVGGSFTQTDLEIASAFADAVTLGFTRYVDLQQLEEHNRELVIERAIERVRAEATGMRQSGDIGKLLLALRQSWSDVGLHVPTLGINVIDEEADLLSSYTMAPQPWENLRHFLIAQVASDGYLFRFHDLPLSLAHELNIALPGGQAELMTRDAQYAVLVQHLLGSDELPDVADGRPGLRVPFRYGGIWAWAAHGVVLGDGDLETGSLFADAITLGYTRYLDLLAAEKNARQQAIEAAVERVRGAALAMQSTDDLPQVAGVLKRQVDELIRDDCDITITYLDRQSGRCLGLRCVPNPRKLGLEWSGDGLHIIDDDLAAIVSEHTEDDSPSGGIIRRVHELWDHGQPEQGSEPVTAQVVELVEEQLASLGIDPEQARQTSFFLGEDWTEIHRVHVPFSSGMVGCRLPEHDGRVIPILQELTEALDLGFVRFLDFQRLEEQNRRQAIDNAAERVRSAAMSMASPSDLRNVAGMLFTEMRSLGIQTPRVSIDFRDPRSNQWQAYHTNINPRRFGLEWTADGLYEYSDEVFSYVGSVNEEWQQTLSDLTAAGIPRTRSRSNTIEGLVEYCASRYGIDPQGLDTNPYLTQEWVGDWEITDVPFDYGMLEYWERQHDVDGTAVVQELMVALNLGFLRFLDFQRLEDQITRLEEAHEALELANEQIQQANRLKSEFLANMSHELRTPMNAIVGFSKLIHRKAAAQLDRRQVDNLERVMQSAEILMTLINEVLDLSKIEAGRLELQPERFDLRELLESSIALVETQVKRGVSVRTRMARDLLPIWSDPARVRQIVINLLNNAAKFTESGQIRVGLRATHDCILISIADSGIGIPEDKLETIFEEFRQADGSTTRKYGGTGLGLSISRRLAQMLGGDITVESTVGEGSRFTFSLPRAAAPSRTRGDDATLPVVTTDGDGRIILSIDDDPDVINLITQELEEDGYQVVGAQRAVDGIEKAQSIQPHAITLDIMMPGMDGWEAITRLKANPETRDIPIIVVSIVDNKELGYRLGADEYLIKPVDRESLAHVLQRYEGRGKQVLVTDDDPVVIELTRQLLEDDGWTVRAASNGQEALDALADERPDVMLLDLMMPVMDGFETLRRLRDDPATADLPVIIVTAKDLAADEVDELRANASRVIEKDGLDKDRILDELRQAMRQVRGGAA